MSVSLTGDATRCKTRRIREISISLNRLFETVIWLTIATVAFYNLASLNPDKDKVGLDKFVLLKLALTGIAGMIGIYGAMAIPRVTELLCRRPAIWFVGIAVLFTISSFLSVTPLVSLASSISLWCILLFTTTAVVAIGPMQVVKATLFGITGFVLASWFAWLAVPELGVFAEPISDGRFTIRMSGIAHPNVLGQYSAIGAGLLMILHFGQQLRTKWVWAMVIVCLGALVMSISRGSILALFIAGTFVYRDRIWRYIGPLPILFMVTVMAGGLWMASTQVDLGGLINERLISQVSKSGETEELTTMTGRTDIWQFALARLQEKPWTGPGPATSKEILRDYSSYTHNLWLNVAFCGGVFAFLCMLGLTFGRVADSVFRPVRVADFIVIFILVNGLVENVVFSFIPAAPTMLLITASLWRVNQSISDREATQRQ